MSKLLSNISLRVWHPHMTAEHVSTQLGLTPEYLRSIGEPRAAPNGRLLGGINEQTYVWFRLIYKERVELGARLESCYVDLQQRHAFIQEIGETGGEVEFYVSVFLREIGGFRIPPALVEKFAGLGLAMSVELYPEDE